VQTANGNSDYTIPTRTVVVVGSLAAELSQETGRIRRPASGRLDPIDCLAPPTPAVSILGMKSGVQSFMTTTTTPIRSKLQTALATAALLFLVASIQARVPDPRQADREDGKRMKKTESGLQYRDIKEGTGEPPATGQTCAVHYTGWLWENGAKGKKFDSSVDRGQTFSFHVGEREVIKGWDEGVATMKAGGKRELLIPADLAYGARGAGGVIPPNATLLFEVELVELREKWEKTESGLAFMDTKEGTGAAPRTGQTCTVHYTGWLWQNNSRGKKFDSSVDRRQPFSFRVNQGEVIKGWDEGVLSMKVGGKRRMLVPANLGYGDDGSAPVIPPGATLLFEVELLKIR
jgi:peptidylprolyl isomerase